MFLRLSRRKLNGVPAGKLMVLYVRYKTAQSPCECAPGVCRKHVP